VPRLTEYIREFVTTLELGSVVLVGNSLGGHVALLYALDHPETVHAMVLSGSSGIYETTMGSSFFRRQDREFIKERTEMTFYDPSHATEDLVDEMLEIVNDRPRAFRLLKFARSADEETVTEQGAATTSLRPRRWPRSSRPACLVPALNLLTSAATPP
jgi:pimeloyl-ACP methyl ester carboxylesterase